MNLFQSPEESLNSYFNELLDEGAWAAQPQLVAAIDSQSRPIDTVDQAAAYVESLKKQKLEQLFVAARTQILTESAQVDAPVVELAKPIKPAVVVPLIKPVPDKSAVVKEVQESVALKSHSAIAQSEELQNVPEEQDEHAWCTNGRPNWAQERFDVLLFDVAGLQLAVPLIALGQIQPITEDLTPLFGQADWFMGLQPTPQGQIRTVNTAKFVMPERYDARFLETAKYVVSINGVPWGLAVDDVKQPITLMPDDVRWRTDRSKRGWLAGTVKEHMCALLDIPRMGQLLQTADKNAALNAQVIKA